MSQLRSLAGIFSVSLQLLGCQSLQNMSDSIEGLGLAGVPQSSAATVGLPSCSGVLIMPQIVLTRKDCLKSVEIEGYVVLGQERKQPVRKLIQVGEVRELDGDLGLLLLKENAPKPYFPLQLSSLKTPLVEGQRIWFSSYAPAQDLQSFGQLTQSSVTLMKADNTWLFAGGPCLSEGSPLVIRQKAQWVLAGLAPSQKVCEQLGQGAVFQSLDLSLEKVMVSLESSPPKSAKTVVPAGNFRLVQEIRMDHGPFEAKVAFSMAEKPKSCEYSLRVVRHNSYVETRYDLKSQTIDPSGQAEARLIFRDIYARLSPLIGRVKHVEISSAQCRSA